MFRAFNRPRGQLSVPDSFQGSLENRLLTYSLPLTSNSFWSKGQRSKSDFISRHCAAGIRINSETSALPHVMNQHSGKLTDERVICVCTDLSRGRQQVDGGQKHPAPTRLLTLVHLQELNDGSTGSLCSRKRKHTVRDGSRGLAPGSSETPSHGGVH